MKQLITTLVIALSVILLSPQTTQAQNLHQLEIVNAPSNYSKKKLSKGLFSLYGTTYFKNHNMQSIVNSLVKKNGKWYCQATNKQIIAMKLKAKGKIKIRNGKLEFADIQMGGTAI